MSRLLTTAAFGLALAVAAPAWAETVVFHATLSTADEVPPKTGPGKGSATATVDTATRAVSYEVSFSGLSGPAMAAHIHGPAAPGANAGVAVPLAVTPQGPLKGSATLSEAQMADLQAGKMYVNVHTAANPAGEIRGQLTRTP